MELEISFTTGALLEVMNEVTPEHSVGKRPPDKSYESKIIGCDLFTFKLFSSYLNEDIYIKFAFNNDELWISSLHKDRPEKRGG